MIVGSIGLVTLFPLIRSINAPLKRKEFLPEGPSRSREKAVRFANTSLRTEAAPEGTEITLTTAVDLYHRGNKRPLKPRSQDFSVVETFEDKQHQAEVLSVRDLGQHKTVHVLLDASASMKFPGEPTLLTNGPSRLSAAKVQIRRLVSFMRNSDVLIRVTAFRGVGGSLNTNVIMDGGTKDDSNAFKHLDDVQPDGSTVLWDAISRELETIGPKWDKPTIVILITDGKHLNGRIPFSNVKHLAETNMVPVICLGLGDEEFVELAELSESSGAGGKDVGAYTNLTPHQLDAVFSAIVRDLNGMIELKWRSVCKIKGTKVSAQITYSGNDGITETTRTYVVK